MPDWGPEIRARLRTVQLSPVREAEIVEEISQHLDDRWRELVEGGTPPDEAATIARTAFMDGDALATYLSPLRQARWIDPAPPAASRALSLEGLMADVRQAVRSLRGSPGFTIAALAVLALGIGATTAIFSVVDAVVLRGLPFDDPTRIVAIGERRTTSGPGKGAPIAMGSPGFGAADPDALLNVQPQNYLDWAAAQQTFESMAAIASVEVTLTSTGGEPEAIDAQRVTTGFFDVLRVRAALGRTFTPDNEVAGRDRVALLSDSFWRRRFAADPAVVGRTLSLDGEMYEVIGVMPSRFAYPVGTPRATALWVPYVVPANERVRGRGHSIYLQSIARLKPGRSVDDARDHMRQIAAAIERANPEWNRGTGVGVRPLADHFVGASVRSWMLMLLASVALVLVIACANVANLLLARATTRRREVAVRAALGASRWRLARMLIVESLLLSSAGAALGVLLAWWAIGVLRSAMPESLPRVTLIALDPRVLAAAAGLALVTGLICGVLPALQSSMPNLTGALSEGMRAGTSRRRQHIRHVLVVAEVALAVVLVVGSALFIGSFIRVMRIDPGFRPAGVLTVQIYQRRIDGQPPAELTPALTEIVRRLGQQPGAIGAAAASPGIPLRVNLHIDAFVLRGQEIDARAATSLKAVTADYHRTLGIPLRSGRYFADSDVTGPKVAIINETAARRFFPAGDALGRIAVVAGGERTVVGIVADARQANLETAPMPETYVLIGQGSPVSSAYLAIRTDGDPMRMLGGLKAAVLGVLPGMPLRYVATLDDLVAGQAAQRRLTMLMLGLFGVLGLVIAAVGVYGVMAYTVEQRTREIGVRMALGATRAQVVEMVLARASLLVALGLTLGGAAAWYFGRTVRSFLFELDPADTRAFVVAAVALAIAALAACVVPARRAATVDPTVALRG